MASLIFSDRVGFRIAPTRQSESTTSKSSSAGGGLAGGVALGGAEGAAGLAPGVGPGFGVDGGAGLALGGGGADGGRASGGPPGGGPGGGGEGGIAGGPDGLVDVPDPPGSSAEAESAASADAMSLSSAKLDSISSSTFWLLVAFASAKKFEIDVDGSVPSNWGWYSSTKKVGRGSKLPFGVVVNVRPLPVRSGRGPTGTTVPAPWNPSRSCIGSLSKLTLPNA
jgi:hypothetical protein